MDNVTGRLCNLVFIAGIFSALATSAHADELDTKLKAQFDRYDSAKEQAVSKVGCDGPPIARDEWEKIISPAGASRFTLGDLVKLNSRHSQIIFDAKQKAMGESENLGIDLRKVNDRHLTRDLCAALPKGGMLHVHPDGTMDPELAYKLLSEANPVVNRDMLLQSVPPAAFNSCEMNYARNLPAGKNFSSLSDVQKSFLSNLVAMNSTSENSSRFPEFQAKFSLLKYFKSMMGGKVDPSKAIIDSFLKRAAEDHVSYVEFTKGCSPSDSSVAAVDREMRAYSQSTGVNVHYNCAFSRTMDADQLASEAQTVYEASDAHAKAGKPFTNVTGIDLFGDENPADSNGHDVSALGSQQIYTCQAKMRRAGLTMKATMHAGELGDVRDSRDAMILGADRLGHGVLLEKDPVSLEYARLHKVPIEINLTSNERLNAVSSLHKHPFINYLRLGLPVSLSTDDEGIFHTTQNDECVRAIESTDITYSELKSMSFNSIRTSFASDAEKTKLFAKLNDDYLKFESAWSTKTPAGAARNNAPPSAVAKSELVPSPCAVSNSPSVPAPAVRPAADQTTVK